MQREGLKYIWNISDKIKQKSLVIEYAAQLNLSYPIIQVLFSRGLNTREQFEKFIFSSYEANVADASILKDADKAVDKIISAIDNKQKILICGDYDVDGITSSAMMMLCLKPLTKLVNFFLPNRYKDGYGLSPKIVEKAAKSNYKILITVDNGISAFEAADKAAKLGLDLIITDHHKPHDNKPKAYAIVNPHQEDCPFPHKILAGVGVTFKILSLLYQRLNKKLPNKVYELLLLGTVADVVPLLEENRYWTRYGLKYINSKPSLAINTLRANAKFTKDSISSLDIGFSLAPQINALGRLEDARDGVKFLISNKQEEVEGIGKVLQELNESRKQIERKIFKEVDLLIQEKKINLENEHSIVAYAENWPAGVIGLVASRLVNAYNRPTILLHKTNKGILKGSCRSIAGYNIFESLNKQSDILISYGGHAQAAGLALHFKDLDLFKQRLNADIKEQIPDIPDKRIIDIDASIYLSDANAKLIKDLNYLEPFGNQNEQPIFYVEKASIIDNPVLLKEAHVKCKIFSNGIIKPIIFFNRPELKDILIECKNEDKEISFLVYVTENNWDQRKSVEFQGVDIAL